MIAKETEIKSYDRAAYKISRRFRKLQRLVNRLNARCEQSKLSIEQVNSILCNLEKSGFIKDQLEAIRRAN